MSERAKASSKGKNPVKICDTTFRDAHQSSFATRMRIDDMKAIAPEMKLRTHLGIDSIGLISMLLTLEEGLGLDLFRVSDKVTQAVSVADVIAIVKACAEDRS